MKNAIKRGVYAMGEKSQFLFFSFNQNAWMQFPYAEESDYQGGLRYSSLCFIQHTEQLLMTGKRTLPSEAA